jgi:hypothetical protein
VQLCFDRSPPTLEWRQLPSDVRRKATELIARMLRERIKPHHLGRKAILHVRQSSAHHVTHNKKAGYYNIRCEIGFYDLGWREIEVIDDRWCVLWYFVMEC